MRVIVPAVVLLLAACSDQSAPQSEPGPEPQPMLGEVDLSAPVRVLGTEPFWSVNIDGDGIVYDGLDRPGHRAPNAGPQIQGSTAVWTGRTEEGLTLTVTVMDTECSDGMSDRIYPLTARVQVGDETLNGCAASVDWVMSVDGEGNRRP